MTKDTEEYISINPHIQIYECMSGFDLPFLQPRGSGSLQACVIRLGPASGPGRQQRLCSFRGPLQTGIQI